MTGASYRTLMLVLTLAVGCTKSAPAQAPGTGGAASGGGVTGTGGMATTGRATRTGGATGSGGVAITGGASNSGGTANAGGITGSGGSLTGDAPSTGVEPRAPAASWRLVARTAAAA